MPGPQFRFLHVLAIPVGGEWFYLQATGMARLGHIVQVVLPGQAELADHLQAAGISVEIIPFRGKGLRDQPRAIAAELQLAQFIRAVKPDIVQPARPGRLAVTRLLTDPVLRQELGSRGRERCVCQFDTDRTVAELKYTYRLALRDSQRVRRARRRGPVP